LVDEVKDDGHVDRRAVLRALLAGALAAPVLAACGDAEARHPALTSPRDAVHLVSVDVSARAQVIELLEHAGDGVMIGLGASVFDKLGGARPSGLTAMPSFTGDVLDPARTQGDVLVHVEADTPERAEQRVDDLTRGHQVKWRVAGHRPENHVKHGRPLVRNPFHYTEGHGNAPAASDQAATDVLIGKDQGWAAGGTFLAVRIVQLAQELWDADDQAKQDRIIGRRRDGTWLDGRSATVQPAFAQDPQGAVTPLDSHVRMVNPRTAGHPAPRLLRRSWAHEQGILFMAYQADFEAGFARAQRRLDGEALTPYVLAVGGGYFAVPARRPPSGWGSVFAA
jgi:deferrochelatase/peroxidase EfeB